MSNFFLRDSIDSRYSAFYVHPGAHQSYRHWWEQQLYWVLAAYRWDKFRSVADDIGYLYPHLSRPRKRRRYTRWGSRTPWIRPWDVSTSGESSFRQAGYQPKIINESKQSSLDWREHKQFKRDKAKRDRHRGCPAWLKHQCNKDYRQFQRRLIEAERFDEIGTKTRKDFFDPWMWD